jgi:hypothetical protein
VYYYALYKYLFSIKKHRVMSAAYFPAIAGAKTQIAEAHDKGPTAIVFGASCSLTPVD